MKKYKLYKNTFLIFFILIFLIFYRSPCYFSQNGWWDIQNNAYYFNALENSFFEHLFFVLPSASYFEFYTNLVSKIATQFPNYSKIVDVLFALIIKILIFVYIYFGNFDFIKDKYHKIIIIFSVLLSPPMTPEIWMTSLHSRSYFAILTLLMVFQNMKNMKKKNQFIFKFFIFFNGISSVYASAMSPLFFIKYFFSKKKWDLENFKISLMPVFINIIIFIYFYFFSNDFSQGRLNYDTDKIVSYTYNIIVRPFIGGSISELIFNFFVLKDSQIFKFAAMILTIVALSLFANTIKKKDKILNLLLFAFIIQSFLSFYGSLYSNFVGGRYAVIPGLILIFIVIRLSQIEQNPLIKNFYSLLIIFTLVIGFLEFKFLSSLPNMLECN